MEQSGDSSITKSSGNELKTTYLDAINRLLLNRRDRYLYTVGDEWRSAKGNLTDGMLEAALRGKRCLGIYSVSQRGTSKWCGWDSDSAEDAQALLRHLHRLPNQALLIERSRRGVHLFRFFAEPVPWQEARGYGIAYARLCGLPQIEVFPKGGNLNALRMPQTRHPASKVIYELLDPATGEVIADPVAFILSIVPTPIPGRWSMPKRPAVRYRRAPPPSPTDEHLALLAEVSRYTQMRPLHGDRLIGRCPFHPDHHPSFGIDGPWFECFSGCLGKGRSRGGINYFRKLMRERGMR